VAYATTDELARALRIRVTPENIDGLQACLDAAVAEIDHYVDWILVPTQQIVEPDTPAADALLNRVNLVRAVEWYKSNDAAFGVIGFDETGALKAPRDGFSRHAYALTPLKQRWGLA
jgi:hypothetical protein